MRRNNGMEWGQLSNLRSSAPMGIIYMAWHGKPMESAEIRGLIAGEWKRFAEQAVADQHIPDIRPPAGGARSSESPMTLPVGAPAVSGLDDEAAGDDRGGGGRLSFMWLRDDLYLYLTLPCARTDQAEELLLELGSRFKREWEQRFKATVLAIFGVRGIRLHAGIALVEAGIDDSDRWYEAVKRALVHGQSPGATERSLQRKAFEKLVRERKLFSVYQPILSLRHGHVYGYEALSRFPDKRWFEGPQQLFDFAAEEGMIYTLDTLARERAIEGSRGLDRRQKLFINITAQIMNDPSFTPGQTLHLLERFGLSPHNVVFEITERSSFEDFGAAKKLLDHYRSQGYQIAIDDAGAGYSSLQSIVELQPDFIKIDRSLIRGIHLDPMKEQIVHTFTEFAAKMGISLIAEGIEEEEELSHMQAMGVDFAQGFLLGKPQPSVG